MSINHKVLKFNKEKFDFDQILKDLFEINNLENLHEKFSIENNIKPLVKTHIHILIKSFIIKLIVVGFILKNYIKVL